MPLSESYTAGDGLPAADVVNFAKFINRSFFAGMIQDFFGLEASVPTGWLLCDGGTIGNASSGASSRANADMETLFAILWAIGNNYGTLSIYTSAGAGSTYGADAATDWAANKRIALPDLRGRTLAGRDNMGGSDKGLIVTNNINGNKVGGEAGAELHTMTTDEMPSHSHSATRGVASANSGGNPDLNIANKQINETDQSAAGYVDIQATGGGQAHNNMQPTAFINKIIAAGVTW